MSESGNLIKDYDTQHTDFSTDKKCIIKPINDEDDTSLLITFNQKLSYFIIMLTFVASISGFMFGYDTGYVSSALVSIGTDLGKQLTYKDKELIVSATSLGALLSALVSGVAADIYGRKLCIMFSNVMFIIGASVQVCAHSSWEMVLGRFIMGVGVGIGSLISPLFIAEIAPKMIRGRLTVVNSLCLTGGQLVAYACGAGLTHVNSGWRILVALSIIPSLIQFIFFIFLPDTPRFYAMKGKLDRAAEVLMRSYNEVEHDIVDQKIKELVELNKTIPGDHVYSKIWNTFKEICLVPSNLRALIIGCGLQLIQQFCGWNSLMYFSGTIFETVGFKNPTAVSIIVAATNFIFTLIAFFVIDRLGRRVILLTSLPGMVFSLIICAISFHYIGVRFVDGGQTVVKEVGVGAWSIVIIIFIILFVAFYALGIGTVPWQQSELFPQSVRGIGTACSTATNWSGSLVIASTFLTITKKITPTGTFLLFAAIGFLSIIFIYFCYPELSGVELEEVQLILKDGFNIEASKTLSKKRKSQIAAQERHYAKVDLEFYHHKALPSDEVVEI